ncbi:MAG: hypothetical protein QXN75_03935 [Thermoproteota archaeon]|nr:hypothetical protein [Candidatus Brockarchaeota archaeon]
MFKEARPLKKSIKVKLILLIPKILFSVLFTALFMVLTKIKFWPIFGTESSFSFGAIFGPVIPRFLNVYWGASTIMLARILGFITGYYKMGDIGNIAKFLMSWLTFVPIIAAGTYFAKMFKGDRRLIVIPVFSIFMFLLHPIGREVWYYSLFWAIPVLIAFLKPRIDYLVKNHLAQVYVYSLGSSFTDHAVGSILYLYLTNIPAEAWVQAIPFTPVERIVFAAGITFFYFAIKVSLMIMQRVSALAVLTEVSKEKVEEVKVKEKRKKTEDA